jgi:hypothetical protein
MEGESHKSYLLERLISTRLRESQTLADAAILGGEIDKSSKQA